MVNKRSKMFFVTRIVDPEDGKVLDVSVQDKIEDTLGWINRRVAEFKIDTPIVKKAELNALTTNNPDKQKVRERLAKFLVVRKIKQEDMIIIAKETILKNEDFFDEELPQE